MLDKAGLVTAAANLINAEGPQALSFTRLAGLLGVQSPSLYNHVNGLPELHRELALLNLHLLAERMTRAAIGKSGADAIAALADAHRAHIKANPGVYSLSLRATGAQTQVDAELAKAEAQVLDVAMTVLAGFGLRGEGALHAARGLRAAAHGFATLEIAGGFGLPLDCDESFRRLVEALLRGLGADPTHLERPYSPPASSSARAALHEKSAAPHGEPSRGS